MSAQGMLRPMRLPKAVLLALGALVACQPRPDTQVAAVAATTVAPVSPAPKGINARYYAQTDVAQWTRQFEREGREVHDRKADIIARLKLAPGTRIADVGAGTGLFTLDFARAVGSSGQVVAVDLQPYFLEHITARAEAAGLANVRIALSTATSVGLAAASVDVAFFCDAYHHIDQPKPYLASLFDALPAGGRLIIVDYDLARIPRGKRFLHKHVRATAAEFRAEIEAAGFRFVVAHALLEENFFYEFERP